MKWFEPMKMNRTFREIEQDAIDSELIWRKAAIFGGVLLLFWIVSFALVAFSGPGSGPDGGNETNLEHIVIPGGPWFKQPSLDFPMHIIEEPDEQA